MATNDEIRAKDILPHKTVFSEGDGFYGDGDSSFFMEADSLLAVIDTEMSGKYDLESIDFGVKKSINITAISGANLLVFDLFTLSLNVGDKYLIKLNESTNCVSRFAIGSFGNNGAWTRNSEYVPADGQWHEVTIIATNTYDGKCGVFIPADSVTGNGTVSMEICTKYGTTLKFQIFEDEKRIAVLENIDHTGLSETYQKSIDMTATSGSPLLQFNLFTKSLNIGDTALIRLVESTNCITHFAIGSYGDDGTWTANSTYAPADGQWHEVKIIATNTYDGKCGIYVPGDSVTANGTVSMEVRFDYQNTVQDRLNATQKKVDESSIDEITVGTVASASLPITSGTNSLEFTLLDGALRTGECYKIRMIDPSNAVSTFTLGSFGDNNTWTQNSAYVPADGDWHEVTITNGNSYNDKFGWFIPADRAIGSGSIRLEIQMNYENTLMYKVEKNASDIANIQQSALIKQFDGILKTDESEPLTSVSESGGLAGIFPKFGFIGDSLCSGAVAYNDGTWHYPERYYTSWGLYMCREVGSNGTIWAYSGCSTATWWNSYIVDNGRGINNEGVQDDNERFSSTKIGYVIALGVNDIIASVTVGDVDTDIDLADYTNNADTFAGKYGRIIQKIKEQQPSAKIFVVTIPAIWAAQAETQGYNGVIRDMASKFSNVFVIDFYAYLPSDPQITSDYMYQGHMTTQGYKWIAMAMATYIDYIVRTNPASFKNVALIGHSSDHGQY